MINRSLIRIKTIQILYSYLLTHKDFHLPQKPKGDEISGDTRFAYSVYLDYLFLLLKFSGIPVDPTSTFASTVDNVLKKNIVGSALAKEPEVKALIEERPDNCSTFNTIYTELTEAVSTSTPYEELRRKRKLDLTDNIRFWDTIFSNIVSKNKAVEKILRKNPDFSFKGMEMGLGMFVKTLRSLDDSHESYNTAKEDLNNSLTLAYNLYHALLELPVRLTDMQLARLEEAKNKYLPSEEDLNPNMRFVENSFVKALRDCKQLQDYVADNLTADPNTWRDSDVIFESILNKILASELYQEYMSNASADYATDANFWREIFRTIILPSDELAEALENTSVYWNDDLPIMGTFVLKTIRRSYAQQEENGNDSTDYGTIKLLPKFMNEADERFGCELLEYVEKNRKTYRAYIDKFIDTKQWDTERLAFMDIVLMETAIAEIINFPTIPIPVTFNEYIELANIYSTPRSGQFINGIIYSVIKMLQEEGIITKK